MLAIFCNLSVVVSNFFHFQETLCTSIRARNLTDSHFAVAVEFKIYIHLKLFISTPMNFANEQVAGYTEKGAKIKKKLLVV